MAEKPNLQSLRGRISSIQQLPVPEKGRVRICTIIEEKTKREYTASLDVFWLSDPKVGNEVDFTVVKGSNEVTFVQVKEAGNMVRSSANPEYNRKQEEKRMQELRELRDLAASSDTDSMEANDGD